MQRSGVDITPDSEELFLGLGVPTKPQRIRLLRRARVLDYLAGSSSQEVKNFLAWDDPTEEYESEDADEQQEMSETELRSEARSSRKVWLAVSVIAAICVIWVMVVWSHPNK
jgi:hypothetical protein